MITRLHSGPRMSQIVIYPANGRIVALAGQVPDDWSLDVAGQTRDTLDKIDRLPAEAGVEKANVVTANIWLRDIAAFDEMNGVWDRWIAAGHAPARACVEARLADPAIKVEIQVVAVAPDTWPGRAGRFGPGAARRGGRVVPLSALPELFHELGASYPI